MDRRGLGKALLLLATVVSLVWVVPAAALDTNVRIVRLSFTSGDVQLDRGQGQGFERAILNTPIVHGSRLWARGDDALAEVEFEDGSTMRLTPGASVEFRDLSLRGSGEKFSLVELVNGTAYFDIRNHMGDFRVSFGGQQISVPHAARFRVFGDNGQFKVAVYRGDLNVGSGDHQVEVRNGETFSLDLSDPSRYNLARGLAEGSYDDWNQQREQYTQSYASASTYSADSYYSSFSPDYSYGLADLAYYGNYFYAPAWGWAWQPYYAGAGWNPFLDGAWMWYPQFGYTWISPYPWGWMPYRYGSWNFIPGYGWCWMPGGATWNKWGVMPLVSHPPVNWVALRPPAAPVAGAPGVVTVGRVWGPVYPPGSPGPLLERSLLPANAGAPAAATRVWHFSGEHAGFVPNNGVITNNAPVVAAANPLAVAAGKLPAKGGRPANAPRPPAPAARSAPHEFSGHAGGGGIGHAGHR
jgi:hypothetical protein